MNSYSYENTIMFKFKFVNPTYNFTQLNRWNVGLICTLSICINCAGSKNFVLDWRWNYAWIFHRSRCMCCQSSCVHLACRGHFLSLVILAQVMRLSSNLRSNLNCGRFIVCRGRRRSTRYYCTSRPSLDQLSWQRRDHL